MLKKYHVSKNLFDKDNASVKILYIDNSTETFRTSSNAKTVIIPCEPNTTYTISKIKSARFIVAYSAQIPVANDVAYGTIENNTGTAITITTDNNAAYLSMFIYNVVYDTLSFEDIVDTIMLNLGSTPLPYEPYSSEVWHEIPYYLHNTSTDTLTTLPADIYANDTTATVGLQGNMSQSSQPSPTTPIQPSECGERTANLIDIEDISETVTVIYKDKFLMQSISEGTYTLSFNTTADVSHMVSVGVGATGYSKDIKTISGVQNGYYTIDFTISAEDSGKNLYVRFVRFVAVTTVAYTVSNIMLNTGSTAFPYEPYGIKIPILSASTTTPVYLGEVETTRKIKKLVLTGNETGWNKNIQTTSDAFYNNAIITNYLRHNGYCSHLALATSAQVESGIFFGGAINLLMPLSMGLDTADKFKTYLAAQYAAGTPVTVWYVLATPTTGIVNEPIRKIGNYADEVSNISIPVTAGGDTISVGTTVQPSEITVNYKGWHPKTPKESNNGQWS